MTKLKISTQRKQLDRPMRMSDILDILDSGDYAEISQNASGRVRLVCSPASTSCAIKGLSTEQKLSVCYRWMCETQGWPTI
jgi:hypothetical protein